MPAPTSRPPPSAVAVNGGNDRLGRIFHRHQHLLQAGRLRRLAELGDIGAGDEGAAAAGQHDRLDAGIGNRFLHAIEDTAAYGGAQGIHGRAVHRDNADIAMTFELEPLRSRDTP